VTLAVKKVWGEEARWDRTLGAARQGRVCRVSPHAETEALHPLTGLVTVTVERVARNPGRSLEGGTHV
jgi:hypothetical protein